MSPYSCRSAIIAIALACSPVCAQETVTHTYHGFVEEVVGVLPGAIQQGEPVVITYSLDTSAVDLYPDDPKKRFFLDAAGLRVSLPASGLNVAGTGQLQTFDNTDNPDDQISMYIPNIVEHDQLMNQPVISLGMAIISDAVDASGTPDMLDGDGIPTQRLIGDSHVIFIETALGNTNFRFSVDGLAGPTVEDLVEDGLLQLQRAASAGLVAPGIALSLSKKLEQILSSHQSGDVGRACHWLKVFAAQLGGVSHARRMDAETGAQLNALTDELRRALGECAELKG